MNGHLLLRLAGTTAAPSWGRTKGAATPEIANGDSHHGPGMTGDPLNLTLAAEMIGIRDIRLLVPAPGREAATTAVYPRAVAMTDGRGATTSQIEGRMSRAEKEQVQEAEALDRERTGSRGDRLGFRRGSWSVRDILGRYQLLKLRLRYLFEYLSNESSMAQSL
jgi:hypothetical protein